MSEPLPPGTTEPVNPNVRFERKDANLRGIVVAAVALVVLTGAVHLLFNPLAGTQKAPVTLPAGERVRLPQDLDKVPAPRLQVNQMKDLDELRREEDAFLDNQNHAATWVDKDKTVRVSLAEAMRLLADPKTAESLGVRSRPAAAEKNEAKKGGAEK
jgi:hypothetical protein